MKEHANRRSSSARTLEQVPEFRQHLARTGQTMSQFLAHQAAHPAPVKDSQNEAMTRDMLELQRRRNALHATR